MNTTLTPIEHKTQRVLTTSQVADLYGADTDKIKQNYSNNKDRYTQGIHYYILEGEELRRFKGEVENFDLAPNVNRFFLWTERGCLLHAKSLNTDRAWEVYQELVDTYFRVRETQLPVNQLSPELQLFNQLFQALANAEVEAKEIKRLAVKAQEDAEAAKQTITDIKDAMAELPKDQWRQWVNDSLNKIAYSHKERNYQIIRNESYALLESEAGADLNARLRNGRKRLEDSGATKTIVNAFCKLDAIEDDKRLKSIYTRIVRDLKLKYLIL